MSNRSIILCALLALVPLSILWMNAQEGKFLEYNRQKAEQGDAEGQYLLGHFYSEGKGVAQDQSEALKWYRKSAEQGYAEAQAILGRCYKNGEGVPQDYAEAFKWHLKAAKQGHGGAQTALAISYAGARGVKRDNIEAYAWANLAALTHPAAFILRDKLKEGLPPFAITAAQNRSKELQEKIDNKNWE